MEDGASRMRLAIAALLLAATPAAATDALVPGTRLTLKSASGRESLSFKSRGAFAIPVAGSPDDPRQSAATLELANPATGESATVVLPAAHWTASPSGAVFKYRDTALVETGRVKVALVGGRLLKISGRRTGITLDEPAQSALTAVLAVGSLRYCARFDGASIRRDQPGRFDAANAPPPTACPTAPVTTSTSSTTSTVTTASTTTLVEVTVTTITTTSTTVTLPPCPPPPLVGLGRLVFTTAAGSTNCGGPGLVPAPEPPFSGEVDDFDRTRFAQLGVGCLYSGGGAANVLPPIAIPDGGTSVLDVAGVNGLAITLTASDGSGPADCTKGAGPGRHCTNGQPGTDGNGACATDADCGPPAGACDLDANCFFGPPIPVPAGPFSVCILSVIRSDICGSADLLTRDTTLQAGLGPRIYLTSDAMSPCPRCDAGVCTAGKRAGLSCSGGVGSKQTTLECPPRDSQFAGRLVVTIPSLGTGTSRASDPNGLFCPGQRHQGAFGDGPATTVVETGSPLLGSLNLFATTLAGTFCLPRTGNLVVDANADAPGPGAISVAGTASVELLGLPPLP
jgi:hypothetical protein